MRAAWLLVVAACSFEHGTAPATPPMVDAPRMIDGSGTTNPQCPGDYPLTFDGHVYKLISNVDWSNGQLTCQADQGHLVKIETMAENDFLHMQIGTGFAWIGLKDTMMNDMFFWTDGTPLGSFQDFASNPASPTKDCVDMGATAGTWAVYTCTTPELALCECP